MGTDVDVRTERRKASSLKKDERFCWRENWYVFGIMMDRPMAIRLVPNASDGNPGKGGHAPPFGDSDVDVLIVE